MTDGLHPHCISCRNYYYNENREKTRKCYLENRDKIRKYYLESRKKIRTRLNELKTEEKQMLIFGYFVTQDGEFIKL